LSEAWIPVTGAAQLIEPFHVMSPSITPNSGMPIPLGSNTRRTCHRSRTRSQTSLSQSQFKPANRDELTLKSETSTRPNVLSRPTQRKSAPTPKAEALREVCRAD